MNVLLLSVWILLSSLKDCWVLFWQPHQLQISLILLRLVFRLCLGWFRVAFTVGYFIPVTNAFPFCSFFWHVYPTRSVNSGWTEPNIFQPCSISSGYFSVHSSTVGVLSLVVILCFSSWSPTWYILNLTWIFIHFVYFQL